MERKQGGTGGTRAPPGKMVQERWEKRRRGRRGRRREKCGNNENISGGVGKLGEKSTAKTVVQKRGKKGGRQSSMSRRVVLYCKVWCGSPE